MKSSVSTLGVHDTLRDFTADRRLLVLSAMAIATGSFGAGAAVKSRRVSCTPRVETELFMVLR